MRFEWDETKNRRNLKKHGISFESAKLVFDDPQALSDLEREVDGEDRWQTVGVICASMIVVVAHSYYGEEGDEEVVRIISARKASPSERRAYEEGNWPLG